MADLINDFTHHSINRDGVIINLKTGNIKAQWIGANGYKHVDIQEYGIPKKIAIHRLLALQYLPNPEHKRTVNHIDGNKLNNNLTNLEWATDSENVEHAYKIGLQPDQRVHNNEFFEDLLINRFLKGESITSISKSSEVFNTLTQTSIHLRRAAERLSIVNKYETELIRQKTIRAKSNGISKRKTINLQMLDKDTKKVLHTFSNLTEAVMFLNKKSAGPISNVISGRTKTAYGYIWVKL